MRNLKVKKIQWFNIRYAGVIFSLFYLLCGCSSTPSDFRWVNPDLVNWTSPSSLNRNVRDEWAKKIDNLPIELHGKLPSNSALNAMNVIPDDVAAAADERDMINSKKQRLVFYVGAESVPERQDFCVPDKRLRALSDANQAEMLRGAVCDGSTIVAYASEAEKNSDSASTDFAVRAVHLKKTLIAALYPAPTIKEAFSIGGPAGW